MLEPSLEFSDLTARPWPPPDSARCLTERASTDLHSRPSGRGATAAGLDRSQFSVSGPNGALFRAADRHLFGGCWAAWPDRRGVAID